MENVFDWYPTFTDFGSFGVVLLTIILFGTLFYVSRKQKPEESFPAEKNP